MVRKVLCTMLVVVFALTTAAFAERILTVAWGEDMVTIDPHNRLNRPAFFLNMLVYEGLTFMEADGSISPLLATSWEVSADGLTWLFNLREDVKFHNGEDFDAEAVKYSIERIISKPALLSYASLSTVKSVEVIEAYTVKLHMAKPNSEILYGLARDAYILPPIYSKNQEIDGSLTFETQMGTGPFTFVRWIPEEEFICSRNPDYWGWGSQATTNIDRLVYKVIKEPATRVAALQTGEVDMIFNLPVELIPMIKAQADLSVAVAPSSERTCIYMQTSGPCSDVLVRKAVKYSIDRKAIQEALFPYDQPLECFIPNGLIGHNPYLVEYDYNPSKARALLEEAGYPDGLTLKYIAARPWFPKQEQLAALLQEQMKAAGITLDLQVVDEMVFRAMRSSKDWDLMYTSDGFMSTGIRMGKLVVDPYYTDWLEPEWGRLLDQALAEPDNEIRNEIYMHIASMMHERGPFYPLLQFATIDAYNTKVEGAKFGLLRYWWIEDVQIP